MSHFHTSEWFWDTRELIMATIANMDEVGLKVVVSSYSSNCQGCVWSHSYQHVLACAHHGASLTGLLLGWAPV